MNRVRVQDWKVHYIEMKVLTKMDAPYMDVCVCECLF